jgi:hypothetical protein
MGSFRDLSTRLHLAVCGLVDAEDQYTFAVGNGQTPDMKTHRMEQANALNAVANLIPAVRGQAHANGYTAIEAEQRCNALLAACEQRLRDSIRYQNAIRRTNPHVIPGSGEPGNPLAVVQTRDHWERAVGESSQAVVTAEQQVRSMLTVEETVATANPFSELIRIAYRVNEEESQRLVVLDGRPEPTNVWGVRLNQLEIELNTIVRDAIGAAERTGFPVEEVERKVVALAEIVIAIRRCQRDAPVLSAQERELMELSGFVRDPAGEYLTVQANRMFGALGPVQRLADRFAAGSPGTAQYAGNGNVPKPKNNSVEKRERTDTQAVERKNDILRALLMLKAVSERRRVSRKRAAMKADPGCRPASYSKTISALATDKLVQTLRGPGGGIWLTSEGLTAAQALAASNVK